MSATTSVTPYRTRPVEVLAIHWDCPTNCDDAFALLGHDRPNFDHNVTCASGWIVRRPGGMCELFDDESFHDEFERPDPMTNEYSWGQSVGASAGVVDIPLNDAGGEWVGRLLIGNRNDVVVLRDMLDGVLGDD